MPNITMTIDEKILKRARKFAIEKNTTLTALVRQHLVNIAEREEKEKEVTLRKLKSIFNNSNVIVDKKWSRDELHER